ncbi:hypothetical protein GCM10007301_26330 [Azorhizobium oxalatiphilum]|uniref:Autotransporter domain-containing protein n=1 Tax=Azorhizobium oxalatiphilum TaxID=980631 RepID=A0A917C1D2_9HYPH|nr:autotransporter domain-containing protein [Azorhizobium oxalatiphilum]GGF65310.1 hypothetical protein GCM10007301_26330 [Azorhizobium oxalatiphilum]
MRSVFAALSLALLSSTAFAQTAAPTYTSLWSLGDSLSDVGRTYARTNVWYLPTFPKGPLYYNGHFSNGQVWVEYLSAINNLPYNADRNLAWGGAVTGPAYATTVSLLIQHLEQQVGQFTDKVTGTSGFLGIGGTAQLSASNYGNKPLITFWIGGNNFRQSVEDTSGWSTLFNNATKLAALFPAHDTIITNVPADLRKINSAINGRSDIAQNGATYYVPTVADVSTTPKFSTLPSDQRAVLSTNVKQTNRDLKVALYNLQDEFSAANPNTRIVVIDAAALLAEVQANPTAYGFTDAVHNCVDGESGEYTNGCSAATVGNFLFWDEFHPTTKAHEMIAQYATNTDWLELGAAVSLTNPYVANIEIRDRTFAGTIGGSGSMIKQGERVLTISGQNTYTGGTRIDAGTVRISSDANLGAVSGLLTLNGGAISASSSFAMQRNVQVNATGGTFDAQQGAVFTLTGNTISGDGNITKTGTGTVDFRSTMDTTANTLGLTEAISTTGRQLTTVSAGTLKINTTNAYITYRMDVAAGAILGGSGTILTSAPGAVSTDGRAGGIFIAGTLAPGNSIGTLTIDGNVTFTDAGVYQLEVDNDKADHLVVTGTMNLDGHVQIVTDPTDKITNQSFTFATSDGALSGAYDGVVDASPFLAEWLTYSGNTATVHFARNFAAPARTANQLAVAQHLNAAYRTTAQGDLDNVFYGLDTTVTDAAGANALDQLSGAALGSLTTADAIQRGQFTRALEDRMSARRSGRTGAGGDATPLSFGPDNSGIGGLFQDASSALARMQPAPAGTTGETGVSAWTRVMGGPANIGGQGATDMQGLGVLLGMDKSFGNGLAGFSFGYGMFETDPGLGGRSSADSYQASLYGSLQHGNLFLDGTLAYAYTDYSSSRTLAFGALSRTATASPDGNDVTASLKAGGVYDMGKVSFEPSVGFDWYHLTHSGFTESGAGSAGLVVGSQTMDLMMPSIGLRLASVLDAGTFSLTPEFSARYYYNFGDTSVSTTAGLIGAPAAPFTVESTGFGRNIGVLSAGLSAQQDANLKVGTRYELQLSDNVAAQLFSLDLKYTW